MALALRGRDTLHQQGFSTAVVSMPCWELFEAHDDAYRSNVLGPGSVRVAVEAAVRFGWDQYLGDSGCFIGMSGFGASGPADQLYKHLRITPGAIIAETRALLAFATPVELA